MMTVLYRYISAIFFALLLVSCEKTIADPEEAGSTGASSTKGNLTLSIAQLEWRPFQTVAEGSSGVAPAHLCFAVYDMSGTRVKQVNQKWGDAGYGTVSMKLDAGTYRLVVLAHSSGRNPTMTNLEKIQFNNSIGYSDTYLYYNNTLTVTDAPQTLMPALDRIVALCRFVINDEIPDEVATLRFQYKGGSGHFSALSGLGVTNSTQVVTFAAQHGQPYTQYDLYTFLHDATGTISLTVTALDAGGETRYERDFDVPLQTDRLTWYTGHFFTGDDTSSWVVDTFVSTEHLWDSEEFLTY